MTAIKNSMIVSRVQERQTDYVLCMRRPDNSPLFESFFVAAVTHTHGCSVFGPVHVKVVSNGALFMVADNSSKAGEVAIGPDQSGLLCSLLALGRYNHMTTSEQGLHLYKTLIEYLNTRADAELINQLYQKFYRTFCC